MEPRLRIWSGNRLGTRWLVQHGGGQQVFDTWGCHMTLKV